MDGITPGSIAGVFAGKNQGYPPCTAQAVMEILHHYGIDPTGKRVVVIGRSMVIGRPVAMMLLQENATVTICHTKTVDMPSVVREAELVVVAAGHAGVINGEFVREGQVVIDVGINVNEEGKVCGDVDFASVEPVVAQLTPVPRGVGSVTTSVLAEHVVSAAEKAAGKE
jgi:methylenetetrahydrofolate dehydrogenase (NADP+)/methenyltetrahydrofolate cyclohydrolase